MLRPTLNNGAKNTESLQPVSPLPAEIISTIATRIITDQVPDLDVLRCNLAAVFPCISVTDLQIYEDKIKNKEDIKELYCDVFLTLKECNLKEADITLFNIFTNKYHIDPLVLPEKPEKISPENAYNILDAAIQMTLTGVFICVLSYFALSYILPVFLTDFNPNIIPAITGIITFMMMCIQGTGLMAKDLQSLHNYNNYLSDLEGGTKHERRVRP